VLFRSVVRDTKKRLDHIRQAVNDTPGLDRDLLDQVDAMDARLQDIKDVLTGDRTITRRSEPAPESISSRMGSLMWFTREITSDPTETMRRHLDIAGEQFAPLLSDLTQLVDSDLAAFEEMLEAAGAPYTPGRMPVWQK